MVSIFAGNKRASCLAPLSSGVGRHRHELYLPQTARESVPSEFYRALLDPRATAIWKVPNSMACQVHEFDAREGGWFRISLTYDDPSEAGKTAEHTDTYHGRFVKYVPNEDVVEVDEFETEDPALHGEMTITITLSDADGGTDLFAVHDGLPPAISQSDNEAGWRMALSKLAEYVEAGHRK